MIKIANISKKRIKKKSNFFSRLFFYFSSLFFIGVAVYIFLFSPFLKIEEIEILGNERIRSEDIIEKTEEEIAGKFGGIFERSNFFILSSKKISQKIEEEFRQIRKVWIRKNFPSKITIGISERAPSLIICEERCYILDEKGQAYDEKERLAEGQREEFLELHDISRKKISLEEKVLDEAYVKYFLDLKKKFEDETVLFEKKIQTPSLISGDIRAKTQEGWEVFFNSNIEIEKEFEMLRVVLENKISKEERANLEYIDLRIDNKVYYKFKEQTGEFVSEESEKKENKKEDKK